MGKQISDIQHMIFVMSDLRLHTYICVYICQ